MNLLLYSFALQTHVDLLRSLQQQRSVDISRLSMAPDDILGRTARIEES